jgi:type II secretory pathway pseudopilin PulG
MRIRSGFSQIEVIVSTIIVGVLMVSSFSTIAASRRSQLSESNEVRGLAIAEALFAEIAQLPMREPSCDCGYGVEAGEAGTNRLNFDDVDDYNRLVDSPPKAKNGTACVGYTDLSRSVAIDLVTNADWNATSSTYVGVYRITVTVLCGTTEVCRIVGYRTTGSPGSNTVVGVNSLN